MNLARWSEVDAYFADRLVSPDPALEAALDASRNGGLPDHHVSPLQGKFLMLLARIHGARSILEIGTLGGYSTIWLARGLAPGGRLLTLELNSHHAEVARANLEWAGLAEVVDVRVGPAVATLADVEGPFDLIFIDADKPSNPEYFAWALRLSRPGTVIVVDNVVRDGAVVDEDGDASVQGVRKLMDLLAAEPRVTATAIQTVGGKGYDGFAIAVVR